MDKMEFNVNKLLNLGIIAGHDPDKESKELKQYHMYLWSSRKINSKNFILEDIKSNMMLYKFDNHSIIFTPDSINNIFQNSKKRFNSMPEKEIVSNYSSNDKEVENLIKEYNEIDYTIGSSIIFPIKIDNQSIGWTMNRARGILYKIHDRIDLTLKCIKMYYDKDDNINPLINCIKKNIVFFDLFNDFKEYVDFFLLNDLVDNNYNVIGFDGELSFDTPFPNTIEKYKLYLKNNIKFIKDRNKRIDDWIKQIE